MNVRQIPALLIALLFLCAQAEAKYRTWTDSQNRTVTADFVRVNNGNVVLKQNNGKVIQVPFFSLSDEDQEFVRELLESKGQADQLPSKPPTGFNTNPGPAAPVAGGTGNLPPGATAPGVAPGNAMPPGGYMPGRMPPGAGPGAGHAAPGAGAPPGAPFNPGAYPPGSTPPGAPGASPGIPPGYPPPGYPTGSNIPGSTPGSTPGAGPGINPSTSTGMHGAGMPGMPGMSPQLGSNAPTPPIGVPPVTPGMGGPGTPHIQWVETKVCDKCKKEVPATSKAGDHCPHCGTYWGYETGQDGSKKYAVGYRAGKIVGGIVFLLALVGTGIKKLMGK